MRKGEILAPAGDYNTFITAVEAGANAVYISGKNFGARAFATNFSLDEIKEAVTFAHLRGVRVYVTVNTIIYEHEFTEVSKYIDELYNLNVDALIVQDLGLIHFIRKTYPDFELHLSTQANVYDIETLKVYKSLGIKRIVLARETPLEDIKKFKELGIELEVFVHGALCYAFSGNCLMSYSIGKRSGNRGTCAQPCRKKYKIIENNLFISHSKSYLSMKDLNTLEYIDKLIEVGIDSFKIEGRMKSPEYVYITIKAYKEQLDRISSNKSILIDDTTTEKMKLSFNRTYTKGYLFNETNSQITNIDNVNHQGLKIGKVINQTNNAIEIKLTYPLFQHDGIRILANKEIGLTAQKMFVDGIDRKIAYTGEIVKLPIKIESVKNCEVVKTLSKSVQDEVDAYLNEEHIKFSIFGKLIVKYNEPLTLTLKCGNIEVTIKTDKLTELANNPQNRDFLQDKINKLKDTVYKLESLIVQTDNKAFVSVKQLNEIRRLGVDKLNQLRLESFRRVNIPYSYTDVKNESSNDTVFDIIVHNQNQYEVCKELGFTNIYTDYESDMMNAPRYSKDKFNNSIVHSLGQRGINSIASSYFNVINNNAIELLKILGFNKVYLSNELELKDLKDIELNNIGIMLYGRYDLMVSRHCMIAKHFNFNHNKCGKCLKNDYKIVDEYNNYFPIFTNSKNCSIRILDYKITNNVKDYQTYNSIGIKNYLLVFTTETKEDIVKILLKIV